jgi:galactose mutarotase-like enzyme
MADEARVIIGADALTATISLLGAELIRLRDHAGADWLHDGETYWTGRAPVLFPIVGALNGGVYRHQGQSFALPKHGFARGSRFVPVAVSAAAATLRLTASDETRAVYPFEFVLDLDFSVAGATLAIAATVRNAGAEPMPASIGFHPAFAWPLPGGGAREAHRVVFEHAEPGALAALTAEGLIATAPRATPVAGDTLALRDDLFAADALIWPTLASHKLRYEGTSSAIAIAFPDTAMLGMWTKPGAPYLCIEPWAGIADPVGFSGDIVAKPGIFTLAPGAARTIRMAVTIEPARG